MDQFTGQIAVMYLLIDISCRLSGYFLFPANINHRSKSGSPTADRQQSTDVWLQRLRHHRQTAHIHSQSLAWLARM